MPENPAPSPISEEPTLDRAAQHTVGAFGGMGEIWLAEHTEPVRRQVALKVIKAGMESARDVPTIASAIQ